MYLFHVSVENLKSSCQLNVAQTMAKQCSDKGKYQTYPIDKGDVH